MAGLVAVMAALWGMLASIGALRGEEDAGRQELVLSEPLRRSTAYLAAIAACGLGAAALWLAVTLSCIAAQLPAGESAYLALAIMSAAGVFAGLGALVSQIAPTRRVAKILCLRLDLP